MTWSWPKRDFYGLARFASADAQRWLRLKMSPIEARTIEARTTLVRAIYDALLDSGISYALEPYDHDRRVQPIRTPQEILDKPGWGTCLDLSLLFAGLCLAAELFPTVILLEGHALVAVSLDYRRPERPFRALEELTRADLIRDVEQLRTALEADKCVLVECTGFARGKLDPAFPEGRGRPPDGGVLDFDAALSAGDSQLAKGGRKLVFAFDVATAHEEWGMCPPVTAPMTPVPHVHAGAALAEKLLPLALNDGELSVQLVEHIYAWAADATWPRPNFGSRFAVRLAFLGLADALAPEGEELPLRKFARGIAAQLEDARKLEILNVIGPDPPGLTPVSALPGGPKEHWVLVEIVVEAQPPQRLQFAAWLFIDGRPPLELERTSTEGENASEVLNRIRVGALKATGAPDIQFDFLVSDELLADPVDQWKVRQAGLPLALPLGQVHPVVVRPISRTQAADSTVYLRSRYQGQAHPITGACCATISQFNGTVDRNVATMSVDTTRWSATDLFLALGDDKNPFFVVLDRAPALQLSDDGLHGLVAAGIPAMLWIRGAQEIDDRNSVVTELRKPNSASIPRRVYEMRRQPDFPLKTKVTLVWDDPNRVRPGQGHLLSEPTRNAQGS